MGEDGPDGLPPASRAALEQAEIVFGPARHLALLPDLAAETQVWPVPFADGIPQLLALRGRRVVALASGDPFWFGAGTVLVRNLARGEWRALPGPSTFSLAAARLGWGLETTTCLGLHAAPFERLRPHLARGNRLIVLLRDGQAPAALADWLTAQGFGATRIHVLEALGGPRERISAAWAEGFATADIAHPVCVGLDLVGEGATLPLTPGRADDWFDHDGQITKSPMRALTLAALAPRAGEHLWDLGAGSGSVAIEWLLAGATTATGVERDPDRAARARLNADRLGVGHRFDLISGDHADTLPETAPQAVFIGGGLTEALLSRLWARMPVGARLVANAVTLESESLLAHWHAMYGGGLTRIDLAQAAPLGGKRGWKSAYPVVQWSVTR